MTFDPNFDPDDCMCDWPAHCGGLGLLDCTGCGGDQCVCLCGGEMECDGCEDCASGEGGCGEGNCGEWP